jgi:hypothetical protein
LGGQQQQQRGRGRKVGGSGLIVFCHATIHCGMPDTPPPAFCLASPLLL